MTKDKGDIYMTKKRRGFEENVKIVGADGSIFDVDLKEKGQIVKEMPPIGDIFAERGKINRRLAKFLNREQKIIYDKDF